jgi:hypothetical protein
MGAGHRTIAVPIRRQRRLSVVRFGSHSPKRLATARTAGTSVIATATATSNPTAQGTPIDWKMGMRVKLRHSIAPAIVNPEPKTTGATLRNVV